MKSVSILRVINISSYSFAYGTRIDVVEQIVRKYFCYGQWCRFVLSIGGDNLQFHLNFAPFSTLGG